jgi:protein SHQ1
LHQSTNTAPIYSTPAPLIEVIQSTTGDTGDAPTAAAAVDATVPSRGDATLLELEKRFAQVAEEEAASHTIKVTALKPRYGFNNAYSDVFRGWHGDTSEILSLPEPENTHAEQRRQLRETGEDAHFDIERYLLDFANAREDEYLAMALEHVPHWRRHPLVSASKLPTQASAAQKQPLIAEIVTAPPATVSDSSVAFQISSLSLVTPSEEATQDAVPVLTELDRELLQRLPNKEFLIPKGSDDERLILGGLLDVLIGYVYEQLTTQGDSGIESTWTISILSPTLAWLDSSADVSTVIRAGVRRMLTYPLLRQYELAMHVINETVELLRRGKRVVLHCLLDVFRIVEKSETQYLLNTIYIQDYCIWIQTVSDEQFVRLAEEVSGCLQRFRKADSGWALEELERQLLESEDGDEKEEDDGEASGESSDEDSSDEGESSGNDDDSEEEAERRATPAVVPLTS